MNWLRRALLEVWAVVPIALVVGFLGPFGTYSHGDLFQRWGRWWVLLMGAYVVLRPTMVLWDWVARGTRLPRGPVMISGMVFASFPLALLWRPAAHDVSDMVGGYSGLLPFTLLCSLVIFGIAWWADRTDKHLQRIYGLGRARQLADSRVTAIASEPVAPAPAPADAPHRIVVPVPPGAQPRLYARLTPRFEGEVLALESEDHYVRVHGMGHSELLLLRLRDAIAEMDDSPGEQVHRSWWVARDAVARIVGAGRHRQILLVNGTRAPVARDSVERLQRSGFLPAQAPQPS